MTFGLNALVGRKKSAGDEALMVGEWNAENAYDLINYTASKGYKIDSYELGKKIHLISSTFQEHTFVI